MQKIYNFVVVLLIFCPIAYVTAFLYLRSCFDEAMLELKSDRQEIYMSGCAKLRRLVPYYESARNVYSSVEVYKLCNPRKDLK